MFNQAPARGDKILTGQIDCRRKVWSRCAEIEVGGLSKTALPKRKKAAYRACRTRIVYSFASAFAETKRTCSVPFSVRMTA